MLQQLTKDGCDRRAIKKRERTEKKQPSGKFLSEDVLTKVETRFFKVAEETKDK